MIVCVFRISYCLVLVLYAHHFHCIALHSTILEWNDVILLLYRRSSQGMDFPARARQPISLRHDNLPVRLDHTKNGKCHINFHSHSWDQTWVLLGSYTHFAQNGTILLAFTLHFNTECTFWPTNSNGELSSASTACIANESRLECGQYTMLDAWTIHTNLHVNWNRLNKWHFCCKTSQNLLC